MRKHKFLIFMSLVLAVAVFAWASGDVFAQAKGAKDVVKGKVTRDDVARYLGKVTPSEQKAAMKRNRDLGLLPGVAGAAAAALPLPGIEGPGGVPHYFGPYGNWAFSPLPRGPVVAVTIVDGGTGYTKPLIAIDDAYGTGASITISAGTAGVTITLGTGGVVQSVTLPAAGVGADFSAPVATIVDDPALCGGAGQPACGSGALADAVIGGTLTGGMRKFIDKLPGLTPAGANLLGQYIPVATPQGWPIGCTGAACTADYYEIALVEFSEQMHSDLLPTKQRGYVQLATAAVPGAGIALTNPDGSAILKPDGTQAIAVDKPHFLGPVIVAQGRVHGLGAAGNSRPVRIKFYNLLPTGAGGNLFIPVDESVMGSGVGPAGGVYTQNRATIHLHGNNTVWISDGNVHQWITPANEPTDYPQGVSVRPVPDMADNGDARDGVMTFFYTNAQSARLQFYHDHAMGITRLNVYAGEAAGYVLTDLVEKDMIEGTNVTGVNNLPATPPLDLGQTNAKVLPGIGIPLVIQDRTWVDADTIFAQDPTWNSGTGPRDPVSGKITGAVSGDYWYPHVYMTVQNPDDLTGTNAFGRWHYGPWFNPPTPVCVNGAPVGCIEVGPVPNEYCLPTPGVDCSDTPWEARFRPGIPNTSIPGESFMDTPIVNGTAYPYLNVPAGPVRFRILNAANDRMFNLQLYIAADKTKPTTPGTTGTVLCDPTPADPTVCTEVKMVPVSVAPANQYADTPSGIPDPATKGPDWWLIGTEGGWMPKPVVVPQQPIGYNLDPAYFSFGLVNQKSLFLGSAERADVVVDFSLYAGKTLILYNDSPAPVPAGAAPYDYYTGNGNLMDGGGAPTTQPGYGPNTRTIMQIRVDAGPNPTPDVKLANLEAVFAKTATKRGVFELTQDPIIIPQAAYNSAYNSTFPSTAAEQYVQISDMAKTFRPIDENGVLQAPITMPLQMKGMHDEMGGVYDTLFGRMSGMLGLSNPLSPVHVLIPYGLAAPPVDLVKGSVEGTPIGVMPDGTQIWRIFHNGVDTHTIHTHLFHTQLINRVDQSGQVTGGTEAVDPIEFGWKDTFRVNPLEVTYLAMRPTVPTPDQVPFEVPDSVRLIDPTLRAGDPLIPPPPAGWFDPAGNAIPQILNHTVNFGWEYVWHCHILSHEEMDMMHSLVFAVPPRAPTNLSSNVVVGKSGKTSVELSWTDNSVKESQFRIQRATNAGFTAGLTTFTYVNPKKDVPNQVTFVDGTVARDAAYWYRVWAIGTPVGDTQTAGFPTLSADSVSETLFVQVGTAATITAPSGLVATWQAGPQVNLTWLDNANNETGFVVERCTGSGCTNFAQIATPGPANSAGRTVTYVDTTVSATGTYSYRVKAVNATGSSGYSNVFANVSAPAIPVAPTSVTVAPASPTTVTLTWVHDGANVVNFTIQRATNATFTKGVTSVPAAASSTTLPVSRGTYYYRVRANGVAGSSAWTNASPFPIPIP